MKNIFDFHFHLLFKHWISAQKDGSKLPFSKEFKTKGIMAAIDEFMGNAFDGQSSPALIQKSDVKYGITALLAMEYAFAENINGFLRSFSNTNLPINWNLINRVKGKKTSYFELFKEEINYYQSNQKELYDTYKIKFLNRKNKEKYNLDEPGTTFLAFSAEGGHNFSEAKIRDNSHSTHPSENYLQIQNDKNSVDLFSINLVHLSEIPEQILAGFAQGLNSTAQIAFRSFDFIPKSGFGISELGKSFIKTVLTNVYPSLIDLKHMSIYTRYQYYQYREDLISKFPDVTSLPMLSSHTGFTFQSLESFVNEKKYKPTMRYENGQTFTEIQAENVKIGKTDFLLNNQLFWNPWSINLYDEEIVKIMESGGMMGISMDQRILGSTQGALDGLRGKYFKDPEAIPILEWRKWFKEGKLDIEKIEEAEEIKTDREVRHIYLLCCHIIHAVRLGYKYLNWVGEKSPWDHICVGSDYDGLINPINGYENVSKLGNLRQDLKKYIPIVEKKMELNSNIPIFRNTQNNMINEQELDNCIEKFLSINGKNLLIRFLNNWK